MRVLFFCVLFLCVVCVYAERVWGCNGDGNVDVEDGGAVSI